MVLEITVVETLSNIGRLLLNSDENVAGLVVESLLGRVVSDTLDGVTDDLLVVNVGLGGDLTEDHDQTSLGSGFASDLRETKTKLVEFSKSQSPNGKRTFDQGSSARHASRMASETWSQILSTIGRSLEEMVEQVQRELREWGVGEREVEVMQ